MPDLLLKNLEIDNFRTFGHLEIDKLGRVNLITGKNNVGKSSLLEALWLYARGGGVEALRDSLIYRNEVATQERFSSRDRSVISALPGDYDELIDSVKYLFHDYHKTSFPPPPIYVGPVKLAKGTKPVATHASIKIEIGWYIVQEVDDELTTPRRYVKLDAKQVPLHEDADLYFVVGNGKRRVRFKVDRIFSRNSSSTSLDEIRSNFVKTEGLNARETSSLWNEIQLTDSEKSVLEAVRLIAPDVERISVRSGEQSELRKPIPIIRLKGQDDPVPLRVLGDGINRLFGLTLALTNTKGGILLVDEIENGLHYSVFLELWRFLFAVATQFNVQVFATTHSLDCVRSFQKAAKESEEEGFLIRLKDSHGVVSATTLTKEELALATRDHVEVR